MTQSSREALVELLFLALYLDGNISEAEDDVLNEALGSLGWDSPEPRQTLVTRAYSASQELVGKVHETEAYQAARAAIIKGNGDEGEGLTWLYRVLGADGIVPTEKWFLDKIEALLYPQG